MTTPGRDCEWCGLPDDAADLHGDDLGRVLVYEDGTYHSRCQRAMSAILASADRAYAQTMTLGPVGRDALGPIEIPEGR